MELSIIDIIGYIAAFLTTIASVPQAWHIHETHNVSGLSMLYFLILLIGITLWLVYGLLIVSYPLIVANIVSFILVLYIVVSIIRFTTQLPNKKKKK